MNENQKNWLLETFFKNEKFAGWRNIAEKLIDTGSCVTTKQGEDIWKGGIGNFIGSRDYDGGVDLIILTFELDNFCSRHNAFFMEYHNAHIEELVEESRKADNKLYDIREIIKDNKI